MLKKIFSVLLLSFSSFSFAATTPELIGIVGAMDVEIEALLPQLSNKKTIKIGSHVFYLGDIAKKSVVVTKSGVGKVNAAIATTLLADTFGVNKLIFTGIAGASSPKLEPTNVVISTKLVQHDVDLTMFNRPKGLLPEYKDRYFFADDELQKIALSAAVETLGKNNVFQGVIASGDQFVANKAMVEEIYKEFAAMAVEMEGAALGQVADAFAIPYVVIRTISDKADGSAKVEYEELKKATANNSAKITLNMLKKM